MKWLKIYKYQNVLEKNNRKLVIKDGFLEDLVEFGLESKEGFNGILKAFTYLIESKGFEEKNIVLDSKDLDDLHVGSIVFDDEEEEKEDNNYSKDK